MSLFKPFFVTFKSKKKTGKARALIDAENSKKPYKYIIIIAKVYIAFWQKKKAADQNRTGDLHITKRKCRRFRCQLTFEHEERVFRTVEGFLEYLLPCPQ